ncbi:MAG: hypothetical protein AB7D29_00840 [Campylobacterales bacterium]
MNISNIDDNKNLISSSLGFYLYELLGVDYSGIYITNAELKSISEKMGIEIKLTDNHKMFGELLKVAKENGRLVEALEVIKKLMESRLVVYEELANNFPKAEDATSGWTIKAKRAIRKIENAIKEVQNESVSS